MRTSTRRVRHLPVTGVLVLVLVILVVLPLGFVLIAALTHGVPRAGGIDLTDLTFDHFSTALSPGALEAARNSLFVGITSAVLAVVIGFVLAFLAARTDIWGRRLVYMIGLVPLFLPSYVGALAWAILASPSSGLLNLALRDIGTGLSVNVYNTAGLIFVLTIYYAPYPFLLIHSALSLMNPDLEDAATQHGASLRSVLWKVTLPLTLPAILGSAILVLVLAAENFPVAALIGGPARFDTVPTFIYHLMNSSPSRGNEASAVAVLLVAVVLVVTLVQRAILARRNFATMGGKGARLRVFPLRKWSIPALTFAFGYLAVAVVLPLVALVVVSVRSSPYMSSIGDLFAPGGVHGETYVDIVSSTIVQRATVNSIVVGLAAAAVGTALCVVLSYVVYRTKAAGRSLLEYLAMAPLAVPSIVMGLGLLWFWVSAPVPVYGTLLVLVIAFVAAQLPQGFRGVSASIAQIDKELEESAVIHGAHRLRAIGSVVVPLIRVGITSTFLLQLMLAMRELTVPLFLFTSDTRLLSIVIFDDFENGLFQRAAAVSLLYCAVLLILSTISRRLGARQTA